MPFSCNHAIVFNVKVLSISVFYFELLNNILSHKCIFQCKMYFCQLATSCLLLCLTTVFTE